MVDCKSPECDRSFETERGMKIHYGQQHDDDTKREYTCAYCGDTFEEYRSRMREDEREHFFCDWECKRNWQIDDETKIVPCTVCEEDVVLPPSRQDEMGDYSLDNHFCSKECESVYKSENWVGEDHPTWDGGKVSVECSECGTDLEVNPHKTRQQENYFCSKSCLGEWQSRAVSRTCDFCGVEFERSLHDVEKTEGNYCSQECTWEHFSEKRKGSDNPQWQGGKERYYGPDWSQQRYEAIRRDDRECQDCGMTRDQHFEEYGRDINVHHKTPIRTFDDKSKANELDNLVTLCHPCHRRRDAELQRSN